VNYPGISMLDRVSTPPTVLNTNTPPPQSSPQKPMQSFDNDFSMARSHLKQSNDEFNFGVDDFPALPGFKGGEPTSTIDDHHFAFRNQNSVNMPYNTKVNANMNPQLGSYQLGMQPSDSTRPQNVNNVSSYEQFLPHLRQSQASQPKAFMPDRFGLLGLLSVIRMTDPDLNTLALGTDLTTLGLNLNSPDCLYSTFASPWAEGPSRREPEFFIPMCYYMQTPLPSPVLKMSLFSEETLFYIFYSMPRDLLQAAAASELYKRDWRYHKEHKLWLTRVPSETSKPQELFKTTTHERGSFMFFDPAAWEKVRKDNVVIAYDQIEAPPTVQNQPPQVV